MRRILALAIVLLAIVAAVLVLFLRPGQEVAASSDPAVMVECTGTTGVSAAACADWGDEVLALGPPSTTFEMKDVNRLRISRPLLGFGSPCQVEYFLERYPDDPVWDDDIPCR